jgi:outer membrane protein
MKRTITTAAMLAAALSVSALAQSSQSKPAAPAAPAPAGAQAPQPFPTGPVKIATISFEASVLYSNEGQRDFGELQKKFAPRQATLKAQNDEITTLQKQLQAGGEKLSDEERATRVRAIESKQKEFQRASEDFQNDVQAEQQQVFSKIATKVNDYIIQYSKENEFTAVLEAGSQSSSIIYAIPSIDITRAIIAGYNAKSGIAAPPPSAPASGSGATSGSGAGTTRRPATTPAH